MILKESLLVGDRLIPHGSKIEIKSYFYFSLALSKLN